MLTGSSGCLDHDHELPVRQYYAWDGRRRGRWSNKTTSPSNASKPGKNSVALLTPTYAAHAAQYCMLLDSLLRNVRLVDQRPLPFVSVFSSLDDRRSILGACDACATPSEAPPK